MKHLSLLASGVVAATLTAGLSVAAPTNAAPNTTSTTNAAPSNTGSAGVTSGTTNTADTGAGHNSNGVNDSGSASNTGGSNPEVAAIHKDFGRLSSDGASAFTDVHLARVAIYDGDTSLAARLVADAQASLSKAQTDNTSFMKAESELQAPATPRMNQQATPTANTQRIAWLPIDGQLIVGETYRPTAETAAALSTARKNMQNGQGEQAMKALKLASVDVDYTMALAPLKQSIADVNQASALIGKDDYYGASQALKQAEDGVRYDVITDVAHVRGDDAKSAANPPKNNG